MNLSPEQVACAKTAGCAFFPATEMQVQRLTMQQRVFRVAGKPFLLSRDGCYYETYGTLRALIADLVAPQAPAVPAEIAEPARLTETAEAPPPAQDPPTMAVADAAPPEAPPAPEPAVTPPPSAPPRQRRPRKILAAPNPASAPEPLAEPEPDADADLAAAAPADPEAQPAEGGRTERLARLARRRAGGPVPNWQLAGPARRGRLKR